MIMRFRPANIRLINRRSNLPRLLLALSSGKSKNNDNDKNNPIDSAGLTGSLHIRPTHSTNLRHSLNAKCRIGPEKRPRMRQCMVGESHFFLSSPETGQIPRTPFIPKAIKNPPKYGHYFYRFPTRAQDQNHERNPANGNFGALAVSPLLEGDQPQTTTTR